MIHLPEDSALLHCRHFDEISFSIDKVIDLKECDSFTKLTDLYLAEPTLLDPHLHEWIHRLTKKESLFNSKNAVCTAIYQLCKVRGFKAIRVHLDVSFERCTEIFGYLFESCIENVNDECCWQVQCTMLLWASVLILMPFPLSKIIKIGSVETLFGGTSILLQRHGPLGKMASVFLANLLARPDCPDGLITEFYELFEASKEEYSSLYECMASLIQAMPKETFMGQKFKTLISSQQPKSALALRSLLKCQSRLLIRYGETIFDENDQRLVMSNLFKLLEHADSGIRWTCAKGLAKLCGLLNVTQLIELIVNKVAWNNPNQLHGSALCLAEILRKTPKSESSTIVECIPTDFIARLLTFHQPKGTYSLGSNVRNAACFICWAWARTGISLPFNLGPILVAVSIFDNQVSVRRAASAAFQEAIGRWPHGHPSTNIGINLIGMVNFFTVGRQVDPDNLKKIAEIGEMAYIKAMVDHLIQFGLVSHDSQERYSSSRSLGVLTQFLSSEAKSNIALILQQRTVLLNEDAFASHGAFLAISECSDILSGEALLEVSILIESLSPKVLGWEVVIEGWLVYMEKVSKIIAIFASEAAIQKWFAAIKSALTCGRQEGLKRLATKTLEELSMNLAPEESSPLANVISAWFRTVILPGADRDPDQMAQLGYTMAISGMPNWLYKTRQTPLLKQLDRISRGVGFTVPNIEKQCAAIQAIEHLICKAGVAPDSNEDSIKISQLLIDLMFNWTVDSRGDVGSYLREAVINAGLVLLKIDVAFPVETFIERLLRLSFERLERIRKVALTAVNSLLKDREKHPLYHIMQSNLFEVLPELLFGKYGDSVLAGLASSAASPSRLIADPALEALLVATRSDPAKIFDILTRLDKLATYDSRVSMALPTLLFSYLKSIPDFTHGVLDQLAAKLIEMDVDGTSMQSLIDIYECLGELQRHNSRVAADLIAQRGLVHRFPRIRKIFTNL